MVCSFVTLSLNEEDQDFPSLEKRGQGRFPQSPTVFQFAKKSPLIPLYQKGETFPVREKETRTTGETPLISHTPAPFHVHNHRTSSRNGFFSIQFTICSTVSDSLPK